MSDTTISLEHPKVSLETPKNDRLSRQPSESQAMAGTPKEVDQKTYDAAVEALKQMQDEDPGEPPVYASRLYN